MVREVLAVKREILFGDKEFQGFVSIGDRNFLRIILDNFEFKERTDELEHNKDFKQIIPYVWIIDPETKKVFAYRRASNEAYSEVRLRNKWSGGIGGHIDKETEEKAANPIMDAMNRELREEVSMERYPNPVIVGFVNYEGGDVERVHFAVVAIAETIENVKKGDDEMAECGFYSVDELEEMFSDENNQFEWYTKLSWPFVKDYVMSMK